MLATVRRLAIPVIVGRVNVARKQVNFLKAGSKAEGHTITSPKVGNGAGNELWEPDVTRP